MTDSIPADFQQIDRRFADLLRQPVVEALRDVLRNRDAHLVGGVLRDAALGRPRRDIDLVVAGDGEAVAAELAQRFGRRSIRLGGERFAAYRVTTDEPIDIWDRQSGSLTEDLRRRDLTIHSFALDLHHRDVQDPFGGRQDLLEGRLRMTTSTAFVDDPLRVLRLPRYVSQLAGFRIEPATIQRARASVGDLEGVARERIREEIESTLAQPGCRVGATLWVEWGIFPDVLAGRPLSLPARGRLLDDLSIAWPLYERTLASLPPAADFSAGAMGLLLLLLEPASDAHGSALLASLRQAGYVTRTTERSIARLLSLGPLPGSEPEQRWFLHRAGHTLWPVAIALAACRQDRPNTQPPGSGRIANLRTLALQEANAIFSPMPLVSGHDLARNAGLRPGPRLGRILAQLERLQVEGRLTNREEALALATRMAAESTGDD